MSRKRDGREPAEDGPWLDPGAPAARLLLFAATAADLDVILATGAVAAVVARAGTNDLVAARASCHHHAVAFVLHGKPADVAAAGADGVHLDDPQLVASARALLGRERLIGATCGRSRHAAMVAGEAGADYVLFGSPDDAAAPDEELRDLVVWWNELFVLPCAAAGNLSVPDALTLVAAGADLIAVRAQSSRVIEVARALAIP